MVLNRVCVCAQASVEEATKAAGQQVLSAKEKKRQRNARGIILACSIAVHYVPSNW